MRQCTNASRFLWQAFLFVGPLELQRICGQITAFVTDKEREKAILGIMSAALCAIYATYRMRRRQLGPPEVFPVGYAHAWMASLLGHLDKAWTSTFHLLPASHSLRQ